MTTYKKVLALSNLPVREYFRYKNYFQILPVDASAPLPPAVMALHPFIIEFCFTVDETPREFFGGNPVPQYVINNDDANQRLKEILLLLTAFSNDRVFTSSYKQSWFIPTGGKVQWGQEVYYYDEFDHNIEKFSETTSEHVEFVEPETFFNRFGIRRTDQKFDLPQNINELLDAYFSLGENDKQYILSAFTFFSHGLAIWSEHPSLSFAAFVSSIETLMAADYNGKWQNGLTQKFIQFLAKYGSSEEYAKEVYDRRSDILHRGKLFLGEITPLRFESIENGFGNDDFRRSLVRSCRICFVNWILIRNNLDLCTHQ